MKIIINTSNLYFGGGLQVALSFINELKYFDQKNDYYIFMSKAVQKQIDVEKYPNNFSFYLIENSPSSLKMRNAIVEQLNRLENDILPDIIFSVFGPSYWKPKAKHLVGFADGWLYNPTSVAYSRLTFLKRVKMRLVAVYKKYYLKRDSNYYVLETEDAKKKFSNILNLDNDNIFVVGNTYSSVFDDNSYRDSSNEYFIPLPDRKENEFRLMYIAHNHPNKNLEIINELIPLLKDINVRFVLTIDDHSYKTIFQSSSKVINIGPIKQKSCPSVYAQCDALFAPTLLETFSASYPEAMKMQKPILTSDYSFARDTCKDAALYFDPLSPQDIAETIKLLVKDKSLQDNLMEKGNKRVKEFETAQRRAEKYIKLCENIVKLENGE